MRALIVESGYNRGALAACRALARAGWAIGVGSPQKDGFASSSRWVRYWDRVPPVHVDLDGFLEATNAAVIRRAFTVVFGAGDAEVIALSAGRDRIEGRVPYPPHDVVLRAFDKYELSLAARRAGLAAPRTVVATEEALASINGPIVVKSRLHWRPGCEGAPPRLEAMICPGRAEATRRAHEIRSAGGEPLLQEVVCGYKLAYAAVRDRAGRILSEVQQVAEPLFWPPEVGARVRSRTVPVDGGLREKVSALLKDRDWFGLASLEFLVSDDGEPRLTDFNGRFTGSFEQVVAAGSNLADVWACVATGREPPHGVPPVEGIRYHWMEGDLRRALVERRGGLARDILDCLLYARGAAHSIWRRDDPWPAIRYSGHLSYRGVRKLGRLIRRCLE